MHARELAIDLHHVVDAPGKIEPVELHRFAQLHGVSGSIDTCTCSGSCIGKRRRLEFAFVVAAQVADHTDAEIAQRALPVGRQLGEHARIEQHTAAHATAVGRFVAAEVAQIDAPGISMIRFMVTR